MDILVTDSRFSLALAYKVLKILFKAFFIFQETHGDIIICVAVMQLWEECPKKKVWIIDYNTFPAY